MIDRKLIIDELISIDDTGMPQPPNLRQLLDSDVRDLYRRDTTKDKSMYIKECIVIYYLGDPKSPAKQIGLSDAEALKMAIEQAGLPDDYLPDALVIKLINKYYNQNITEAGRAIENILKGIHNINLSLNVINKLLADQLNANSINLESVSSILTLVDSVNKKSSEIPSIVKNLEAAKENLMYEKETETFRGGNSVLSSMDADAV